MNENKYLYVFFWEFKNRMGRKKKQISLKKIGPIIDIINHMDEFLNMFFFVSDSVLSVSMHR